MNRRLSAGRKDENAESDRPLSYETSARLCSATNSIAYLPQDCMQMYDLRPRLCHSLRQSGKDGMFQYIRWCRSPIAQEIVGLDVNADLFIEEP